MTFSHMSLALVWLLLLGFVALAGSGTIAGPWLILLIAAALVMPALVSKLWRGTGGPMPHAGPARDIPH